MPSEQRELPPPASYATGELRHRNRTRYRRRPGHFPPKLTNYTEDPRRIGMMKPDMFGGEIKLNLQQTQPEPHLLLQHQANQIGMLLGSHGDQFPGLRVKPVEIPGQFPQI